jgi:hypothetical protein
MRPSFGRKSLVISLATVTGAVILVLSGCAGQPKPQPGGQAAATQRPAGTAVPAAPGIAVEQARTPKQRAEDDAAQILAAFVPPPAATRLAAAPTGLTQPVQTPGTPDLVDKTAWWRVPGNADGVLGWETRHLPHRFAETGGAVGDPPVGGQPMYASMFSLPPVPAVLNSRQLVVEVQYDGRGHTNIRVDAQVTWTPARSAADRVSASASVLTIAHVMDMNLNNPAPKSVTLTDPARVRQIAALINALPLAQPGTFHCPMDAGAMLLLTFRARPGGPVLAVADLATESCQVVSFALAGQPQQKLGQVGGGDSLAAKVLRMAGLSWTLP